MPGCEPSPTAERLGARDEQLEQRTGGIADRDQHAAGQAALAGGAERGADDGFDGLRHIGIGHHDQVILGAAQRLHALAFGGGGGVDVLRHRRGADEARRPSPADGAAARRPPPYRRGSG